MACLILPYFPTWSHKCHDFQKKTVTQHAKRTRLIISPSMACLILPYFPTLSNIRHYFQKKKIIEHESYVSIFSANFYRPLAPTRAR